MGDVGGRGDGDGLEFNAFTDKYQRLRDFDIAMGSYNATADPDSFEAQVTTNGTQNASGYSNPRVDQLIQLGAAEQDEAKRHQLYDEMQRLIVDDLPQYFMLTVKNFTALDNRVGGVRPSRGVESCARTISRFWTGICGREPAEISYRLSLTAHDWQARPREQVQPCTPEVTKDIKTWLAITFFASDHLFRSFVTSG